MWRRFWLPLLGGLAVTIPAAADEVPATAEAGSLVYNKYCSTCHGDDLVNNSGVSYDLRRLRAQEHARFVNSVEHGKNAMPAWQGRLSDSQVEALWTYVRANAYDAQ